MDNSATCLLLESPSWRDYELLDSGEGAKLERFGSYVLVRPEVQAMWRRALPQALWGRADASFRSSGEESGGHWEWKRTTAARWEMAYPLNSGASGSITPPVGPLRFWAMTTPGRHLGVFPETAANWDWIARAVSECHHPVKLLNLFGYTGLASLAAAAAGAQVTHVDASKKSVEWARHNQALSGFSEKPIRWIVDDAVKFVQREARRGAKYDAIVIDPPKFGRGPKGEVWEVFKSLPGLLKATCGLLSAEPIGIILTVYAVKTSAIHIAQLLQEATAERSGHVEQGELVTREHSDGRLLSQAVFARWLPTAGPS
jgi:23S rRNA (cytosine1962-C5)-methyltransferase